MLAAEQTPAPPGHGGELWRGGKLGSCLLYLETQRCLYTTKRAKHLKAYKREKNQTCHDY